MQTLIPAVAVAVDTHAQAFSVPVLQSHHMHALAKQLGEAEHGASEITNAPTMMIVATTQ
eukprot:19488-Heterococcus_DN1.PRE.2